MTNFTFCLSETEKIYLVCKGTVTYAEPENNLGNSFEVDSFELEQPSTAIEFADWVYGQTKRGVYFMDAINEKATEMYFGRDKGEW